MCTHTHKHRYIHTYTLILYVQLPPAAHLLPSLQEPFPTAQWLLVIPDEMSKSDLLFFPDTNFDPFYLITTT